MFLEVEGLQRGPFSLVSTIEELLGGKITGSGLESREYDRKGSTTLTTWHFITAKVGTNSADGSRSPGIVHSLAQATEFRRVLSFK
jgi:hypothetical protein